MRKKLLAAITVAIMASAASSTPTSTDLGVIERLVQASRWSELNQYLTDNPHILMGDSPLIRQLTLFQLLFGDDSVVALYTPPGAAGADVIAGLAEQY